jgi:ligand-binding sensor domain-containing protein
VTRRRWMLAAAGAICAVAVTALPTGQLRHLALPLIHDPTVRSTLGKLAIADGNQAHHGSDRPLETTQLPGRISAILPRADGVLFVGTFDSGLWRFDPARDRAPREVGSLDGRERFVDALVEWRGHVVAGTHRGAVLLSANGARAGVIAAGEAVSSLALVGDELVVGTAHGLWRGSDDVAVGERGPDGELLRVTALASSRDRIFVGTPDGVYELVAPLVAPQAALWHPLVFGAGGATSNVVTALAALEGGVVAGTDDGGLVFVSDGGVDAVPFAEPRANDVNPGALARLDGALFIGTEGAGLVMLDEARHAHRVGPAGRISAVAVGAQLWFGSEEGALYSMDLGAVPRPVTSARARAASSAKARG